jgi:hypothetical protein
MHDVPIMSQTLSQIFDNAQFFIVNLMAFGFLCLSLIKDKIWFWNWNVPFVIDWAIAIAISVATCYVLVESSNLNGIAVIAIPLAVYSFFFFLKPMQNAVIKQISEYLEIKKTSKFVTENCTEKEIKKHAMSFINEYYEEKNKFPLGMQELEMHGDLVTVEIKSPKLWKIILGIWN